MASTYTSIEELNAFPDGGSVDNSLLAVHIAGSQTYKMTVSDFNQKSTESAQHYAELAEEAYDGSVAIQQAIQASTTAATTAATNAGISEANAAASETAAATAAQEAAASATSLANAVTAARNSANAALSHEEGAEDAATLAQSWAEGGTNTRQGENTNNAHYWALMAQGFAEAGISVCITQNLTKAQWDSHNIGDEDTWLDTATERRSTRVRDIFIVTGTATDSLDAYFLIYRSTTADGDLQGTLLSKSIAYSGDQGYGITASWRIFDTQANFDTYSTVGHHEAWFGSQSVRGTTRIGDIFLVLGITSDTGRAYIMVYRSTTASGDLEGDCIGSVYSDRGAQGERGDQGEPGEDGKDGLPGEPGNGIATIHLSGTSGLVDTYTITMTNGHTATFTVTNGEKGDAATIAVGTVTMLPAGSTPTVTNSGTSSAAVFNFGIPLTDGGVSSFNGRSGSILPMAGDYDSKKILLSSALHIGGETQENVQEALEALSSDGVKSFNGRSGSVLPMAGDYSAEQVDYDSNQTVKQKIDALVTKEASDIAGQQSLVKDTVGWTGKNQFDKNLPVADRRQPTIAILTDTGIRVRCSPAVQFGYVAYRFKLDSNTDYIISSKLIRNTGNQAHILIRGSQDSSTSPTQLYEETFLTGDAQGTFNTGDKPYIVMYLFSNLSDNIEGDITYDELMIRKADITDPTYEPYHESVEEEIEQIYADNGVLGAKNLLPYPYYQTTRTTNGITFTDNGDGTITANGTATADAIFHCLTHITGTTFYQSLAGKAVILSGCPAGGANNKYYFGIYDTSAHNDTGEGLTYQVLDTPPSSFYIQIVIRSGITVNNLTFRPMLRLASDPDDTYQPYAMTNRELTEKAFLIQPIVPSTGDLDNVKTTGIYGIFDPPTHSPESANYCTLLVNRVADNNILQVVFRRNTIYTRAYINGTWYNWFKYAGTELT